MSTLKTHNLQSPDAGSVNIAMAPNAGMVVTGISTFIATVKIGSSVPDAESGSDDLIVGNTSGEHGITIFSGTTSAGTIFFGDGTGVNNRRGAIRYLQSDDSFQFNTNGNSEKVRIKSNGFFGIGTTNPSAKLTVSDTGPAIVDIHHSDGGNGDESRIILGALALNPPSNRGAGIAAVNTGNGHDLSIKTSNTHGLGPSEKLRVKNSGSVGIGTTNPAKKLEIYDDTHGSVRIRGGAGGSNSSRKAELSLFASGAREYVIRADAADAALKIYDASDGNADRLYINSSGSLGVNLSTPKTTKGIHISKGTGAGGIGNSYSLANEYLHFGYSEHNSTSGGSGLFTMGFGYVAGGTPATNSPAYLGFKESSTGGYTKGDLVFATRDVTTNTAPTERLRITASGITQFRDNQAAYTNTVQSHSGEAGFITHYTARTTSGADLYRRMLDIASGGANPHGSSIRFLTSDDNTNPATCVERMRILNNGGVYIGEKTHNQRYPHIQSPGLLTVQNGARVNTTANVFAAPKGGFCDHARYELEQKLINISNSNLGLVQARNGQALTINEGRTSWSYYANLPNYLIGHAATDNINNSNFTLTLYANMTVFLLRTNGWNGVSLSGWTLIESDTNISPASSDTRLYVKTLAAGTYNSFDNDSAMYFFVL